MTTPNQVFEHHELLYVNSNNQPVYEDAMPGVPGIDVQPLFLDPHNGVWVLKVWFHPGVILPRHFHTGAVHMFTISGHWEYVEYPNDPQTDGCYLYEPGGSIHQFMTPETNTKPTETLMVVHGANINFDDDGNYVGILDASEIMVMLDNLIQERGLEPANYITPPQPDHNTKVRNLK
ncbi:2,4'-dihydroxyacetophenone dioxygenase family protein [Marinobacter sp. chi1]|uniref:2,4'-dihydroxyacetophenone dioxygenase family protein n=1 Tax=Marinobacter suaedae TaxID=3057675 RepID=A0ABT8VW89_9GAMM|nr:2,4'-dihydroxyacetophenone dioxygenase family protein [Marinobacter sp. chi1]MDO3720259.1 2,4'-dihydroxyacetophenone dioxygenase family protein [Marinobacter sp. chi1]